MFSGYPLFNPSSNSADLGCPAHILQGYFFDSTTNSSNCIATIPFLAPLRGCHPTKHPFIFLMVNSEIETFRGHSTPITMRRVVCKMYSPVLKIRKESFGAQPLALCMSSPAGVLLYHTYRHVRVHDVDTLSQSFTQSLSPFLADRVCHPTNQQVP